MAEISSAKIEALKCATAPSKLQSLQVFGTASLLMEKKEVNVLSLCIKHFFKKINKILRVAL